MNVNKNQKLYLFLQPEKSFYALQKNLLASLGWKYGKVQKAKKSFWKKKKLCLSKYSNVDVFKNHFSFTRLIGKRSETAFEKFFFQPQSFQTKNVLQASSSCSLRKHNETKVS